MVLAESVPHRVRLFAWLGALLVAGLVPLVIVAGRAAPPPSTPYRETGRCIDRAGHVHAVRVDVVPSYSS